jgi:hypothetical protein
MQRGKESQVHKVLFVSHIYPDFFRGRNKDNKGTKNNYKLLHKSIAQLMLIEIQMLMLLKKYYKKPLQ